MTILVFGGSGQLGRCLTDSFSLSGASFEAPNSREVDITDLHQILAIDTKKVSAIINAAAWTDVNGAETNQESAERVNALGAENIAKLAVRSSLPLFHISTDYVFSGVRTTPWDESSPKNPLSIYGKTKAHGEERVLNVDSSVRIVRTAWLYSPYGKNFAKTMVRLALTSNNPVRVVSDQVGQPTSAKDLAEKLIESISLNIPSGIYHGTNSGTASWFEFAREIFVGLNLDPERVTPISSSEYPQVAPRPEYSVLSHSKWSQVGMSPMQKWRLGLAEILPEIVAAVKSEGL